MAVVSSLGRCHDSTGRVLCYHLPIPIVYDLGLIVGAAVGGGALASIATRFIRHPYHLVVMLLLADALAVVVTTIILFRALPA